MTDVNEPVAEAAEVVAEGAQYVAEATRGASNGTWLMLGAALGFAGGAAFGYGLAKKHLKTKYEQIADEEIGQMRAHFAAKERAAEPKPSLADKVEELGYRAPTVPIIHPELTPQGEEIEVVPATAESIAEVVKEQHSNVFDKVQTDDELRGLQNDVWDYDRELQTREDKEVYIIHLDEFRQGNFQGEEHEQTTLTYFIQDDVLIDERDNQIAEIDGTVGLENLERFGHGSEDANVVYIRNERLKLDIEVLRNGGSYTRDVLGSGADDELQHSAMRRQRPRFDDD